MLVLFTETLIEALKAKRVALFRIKEDLSEDISSLRLIVRTLNFEVNGYLYPPVRDQGVIKRIKAYMNDFETQTKLELVQVEVDPFDAEYNDSWDIKTTISEVVNE